MIKFLLSTLILVGCNPVFAATDRTLNTTNLVLKETGAGTNKITIKPPASFSSNYNFVFPTTAGSNGEALTTDGSGNLTWTLPIGVSGASYVQSIISTGTWVVPSGVSVITLTGSGGGGGGGSGARFGGTIGNEGGAGGSGAVPETNVVQVVPGETITVTIGAGGTGGAGLGSSVNSGEGNDGSAGGNTVVTGSLFSYTFLGAPGGAGGNYTGTQDNAGSDLWRAKGAYVGGGAGGAVPDGNATGMAGSSGNGNRWVTSGGAGGAKSDYGSGRGGCGGGGGGGAGFVAGGAGSDGAAGVNVSSATGNAAAANSGAGGGGSGGAGTGGSCSVGEGGAGGSGYVMVSFTTSAPGGGDSQAAHAVFVGPTSGTAAPTFRSLVFSDLPVITSMGTVTSVNISGPSIISYSAPITTSGTITGTLATQAANLVFAGPTSGAAATPAFRSLVNADLPSGASNPMTTAEDLVVGGVSGFPKRLAAGTTGYILTVSSAGTVEWLPNLASGSLTNPMTTAGDTIYGGAGGGATRLAIGGAGTVLTVSGGLPTWISSPGGSYWSGYHDDTCSWTVTNTSYTAFGTDASCNLVQRIQNNITCSVTGSVLPAIACTLPSSGVYYICAMVAGYTQTASAAGGIRLWDGTTTISEVMTAAPSGIIMSPLCGIYVAAGTSVTFSLNGKAGSGAEYITRQNSGGANMIEWSIYGISR